MRLIVTQAVVLSVLVAGLVGSIATGAVEDLEAAARSLEEATLDPGRAVDAAGIELPLQHGHLSLERGVLVPAILPDDERIFELVFVGRGRFRVEAPNDVEARQLAAFAGDAGIDAGIERAVLIAGDASLAAGLLGRPPVEIGPDARAAAFRLYDEWSVEAEREGFGALSALLRAMADDPLGHGYLGLWFESRWLGRCFYRIDPFEQEPVSFGAYQLFDYEDFKTRRRKKADRRHARTRKKLERKLGRSLDDPFEDESERECGDVDDDDSDDREEVLEWIETWMSVARTGDEADAVEAGLEPEHYRIELDLTGDELKTKGSARIRLRANADDLRVVTLILGSRLEVCEVLDAGGAPLTFESAGWETLVLLPRPTVAGGTLELTVRFAGKPVQHLLARRKLVHTMHWHPHAGILDRATYDVTLRWPSDLTLLASGEPVEGGEADGTRWTRRVLDVPTGGFSFEVGEFDVVEGHVGHIDLTFGFHRRDRDLTEEIRREIVQTVKASLLFFETHFGVLPIDRLTVVLARRGFSQGLLGFVTLAESAMHREPHSFEDNRTGQELRLETIAHEISHQWWGHMVGWDSYRDQWLSEALADFSAAAFMERLAGRPEVYRRKHAELWRHELQETTLDGRPLNSLGPVVLGRRLLLNHGSRAYHAIVYAKGAAIFSTLAQRLGPDPTWRMLGALAEAVNNRVIRTSTFFKAFERMSGQDLEGFVRRYVHGTGLPKLFYEHRFRKAPEGGWLVEGRVRRLPAEQYRYALKRTEHGWDVVRRAGDETDAAAWTDAVPYRVETTVGGPHGPRRSVGGTLSLDGETSEFSIGLDERPADFELDPDGRILAELHAERFRPKAYLCVLGEHLARLGRFDEALRTLTAALEAETVLREADRTEHLERQTLEWDARVRLARARLFLDRGDTDSANRDLRAVEKALGKDGDYYAGERAVLHARLELVSGRYEIMLEDLQEYLSRNAIELSSLRQDRLLDGSQLTSIKVARGEVFALVAAAAYETRDPDSALLVRLARIAGVDTRELAAPDG